MEKNTEDQKEEPFIYSKTSQIAVRGARSGSKMLNEVKENLKNWVLSGEKSNLKGQSINYVSMDAYPDKDEPNNG